jgi:alanyl-tRNA synthetase
LKLLEGEKNKLASAGVLPGHVAFKLYDTYGFPLDLTQDILRSSGHSVDTDGFNMAMEVQKTEARKSWSGSGDNFEEKVWLEQVSTIPATDFIGYDGLDIDAKVLMIVKDGIKVDVLQNGDEGFLLLDQTTFYAESGGQMGDRGILKSLDGHIMCDVIDTSKKAQIYHGHFVKVKLGNVHVGDLLHCQVDANYRSSLQAHHSATHLLHSVLRRLIGVEITQKGSLVAHDRLRFDFSCGNPLTREQIADVEQEVNRLIIANKEVSCKLMSHESAIESGAMALFGEKYGDTVRVVSMGGGDDGSVELCGGTHVSMTGNIGFFKITSESGVASGVRRIEAVCANAAYDYIKHMADQLEAFSHLLKAPNDQLVSKLQSVLDDRKKIEKENRSLQQKLALGSVASGPMSQSKDYIDVNGFKLISRWFDEMPPKELKGIAEGLAQNLMGAVVVVGSGFGEKVSLVAHVSGHTVKMVSAVDIVQNGAVLLGGHGGGGRPDMAQAGGSDSSKWPAFEVWLKDHLSKKSSL